MTINLENINNPEDIENNEVAEHLSILERYILTYIKFRSNNAHIYYGSNEDIAKHAQCKLASAKTKVNQLIRQGYLDKGVDEYGRRTLTPTEKYYIPLDGVNMSNKSKSLMKQDIQNFERMEKQYKQDIAELKKRVSKAEQERDNLKHLLITLQDALAKRGITYDDLEKMLEEEENSKAISKEPLNNEITIEKPLETKDEEVVLPPFVHTDISFNDMRHRELPVNHDVSEPSETNQDTSDVQKVIDDILAKFQIPTVC